MSLIIHDPDEWEPVSEFRTCEYHKMHPGAPWPGCMCMANFGQRRRSPEAVAKIKAERQRLEEDEVLTRAERIRERREMERILCEQAERPSLLPK